MSTPTGRLSADQLRAAVIDGSVDTIVLAVTDMQGRLQGKRIDGHFFFDEVVTSGTEGCSYILASDVEMNTVSGFALSSWENGYGDLAFQPDLSTIRMVPWHEKTAIVFSDAAHTHGGAVRVSPRQILKVQSDRLAELGFHAMAGTELEFIVFTDTFEEAWSNGYRNMTPANQYNVDYSLLGTSRVEPLLGHIRRSMTGAGMIVESVKGECHPGQHEIAFRYAEMIDKCDEHGLFKLGAREIAAQSGCSLTFMAKFDEREGNSCHVHLSLRDTNERGVFAGDGPHGFSKVFEHFLAGLMTYSREMSLLVAPNINSYKRFALGSFAPTSLLWGLDNRTCAFRVVGHAESLRVESRIGGGDVNPYLALSAMVACGLKGLQEKLSLTAAFEGDGYVADCAKMPTTLAEATELFDHSAVARSAFGDDVVDHYVHAAHVELAAFESSVTDWERYRGFERL